MKETLTASGPPPPSPHDSGAYPPSVKTSETFLRRSASQRFGASAAEKKAQQEAHAATLQGALRRAFSVRKSTSAAPTGVIADGYARVHDTRDGDECGMQEARHKEEAKQKTKERIIKACKKLFGVKPKKPAPTDDGEKQ